MFEKEAETTFKKKATKIAEKKVKEFYKECGWEDYKYMIPEFADVGAKCMQKGAEFGYNKANEWHYVKDGKDLPPKTTLVLIKACGCFILGWLDDNDVWHNDSDNGARIPKDNIYAWKEIVLPKEI